MAVNHNFAASDEIFKGEDKILVFTVLDSDDLTPKDVAGWEMTWEMRKSLNAPTAVLSKMIGSGISITGVYNSAPLTNTQRVEVLIADTETEALKAMTYYHALKRMDEGLETILSYGTLALQAAAVR